MLAVEFEAFVPYLSLRKNSSNFLTILILRIIVFHMENILRSTTAAHAERGRLIDPQKFDVTSNSKTALEPLARSPRSLCSGGADDR